MKKVVKMRAPSNNIRKNKGEKNNMNIYENSFLGQDDTDMIVSKLVLAEEEIQESEALEEIVSRYDLHRNESCKSLLEDIVKPENNSQLNRCSQRGANELSEDKRLNVRSRYVNTHIGKDCKVDEISKIRRGHIAIPFTEWYFIQFVTEQLNKA